MSEVLTEQELAERWNMKPSTVRAWRVARKVPRYFRLGSGPNAQIRYRLEDIVTFEKKNRKK